MADAFFQAICCQPPAVFGRRLRPFSLSHAYILSSLGNGWARHGEGSRSELLHAVWICSQPHAVNTVQVLRPPLMRLALFALLARRYDYKSESQQFVQYMADYLEIPDHWAADGSASSGFRAPWQFHFAINLVRTCGMTIEQAWDTPVALARCYYDIVSEEKGDTSLVSMREKELAEAEGLKL